MRQKGMLLILMVSFMISYFISYFVNAMPAAGSRSGPFESSLVSAKICDKWTQPIDKNPPIFLYVEMYNTSTKTNLLRGNVSILQDCKNKQIKSKALFWEQGKWKLIYLMNNIGCNSVFMPVMAAITRVDYDRKKCIFFKGEYTFDGIDTNKTQHLCGPVQTYGRIKWRNEFFSHAGTAFCWEFETLVSPSPRK